jgi:hypothetical protein
MLGYKYYENEKQGASTDPQEICHWFVQGLLSSRDMRDKTVPFVGHRCNVFDYNNKNLQ